ncbi:hypothetical protein EDI_265100 [Entamoeba dispar SAW760]|uniref:Uncharacterized protein n=1 Tax=Entamoeba dispar (strain ATCC PRA-260 / SAW760) TaxID=370354 RepID=B0ENS1_ENTDS|nr:uncharacterized protein EDI_265100 [Entamoeba dispar SAW760]EDR23826.1 hypothetical protein EDI_265100 [Entamoeba dispar SAW760]|eukprot:EDR23826.1 hypothetical protein EDI_265100 [Entamoeba dispar SAW760]
MNMLCFVLFIAATLAKDSLVITSAKNQDGDAVSFISIEFKKCYYFGEDGSMYATHDGNQVTVEHYNSTNCDGDKEDINVDINSAEFKQEVCDSEEQCDVEIKKAPKHVGFYSLIEDDGSCSHRDDTIRVYFTDKCLKVDENLYYKYFEENSEMLIGSYPNDKCDDGERTSQNTMYKCDVCEKGIMYQCGALSTMVISVVAILALFL